MTNLGERAEIAQYLHETVWQYHVPGGGYDVERMARAAGASFPLAPVDPAMLQTLAEQVAGAHCPDCGAALQAGGLTCFCCGWTRA